MWILVPCLVMSIGHLLGIVAFCSSFFIINYIQYVGFFLGGLVGRRMVKENGMSLALCENFNEFRVMASAWLIYVELCIVIL